MALYKGTMILVVLFLSLCLIISSTEFASFTAANWENILVEISAMSPKSPWLATTDPHKCITEVNNLGFNVYHFTHMYLGWTSFSVHSPSFEISLWNSSQCAYGYTILNNRVTFSDLMMILLFTYICHQVLTKLWEPQKGVFKVSDKQWWFAITFFCSNFLFDPSMYWHCLASKIWQDLAILWCLPSNDCTAHP